MHSIVHAAPPGQPDPARALVFCRIAEPGRTLSAQELRHLLRLPVGTTFSIMFIEVKGRKDDSIHRSGSFDASFPGHRSCRRRPVQLLDLVPARRARAHVSHHSIRSLRKAKGRSHHHGATCSSPSSADRERHRDIGNPWGGGVTHPGDRAHRRRVPGDPVDRTLPREYTCSSRAFHDRRRAGDEPALEDPSDFSAVLLIGSRWRSFAICGASQNGRQILFGFWRLTTTSSSNGP